ncbi:ammonia-dependent NAD(+) synthetase [Nesterenkonia marinintestina]|uniref:ammonia-dependent NAD(+) synthetase n=1 Tax=Nesterenkonia marinintestina TaxID=2979865 RepID=UPI0021BF0E2D|nr:ammonia-dependent NAD(+) synthetase [Nesterenkonia sp. GX14115]
MGELQHVIVEEMGVAPEIDPAEEVSRRVGFLVDYLAAVGAESMVLGISGGVDSTLAGRLCQLAAEQIRSQGGSASFRAVRLPYDVQHDEADAAAALEFIRPDHAHMFNIAEPVRGFDAAYLETLGEELSDYHRGNVKARMRMIAQYAIAGEHRGVVIGTDHAAESVTGFFTKFGDGGADVLPLFTLNKRQVRQVLDHLGAPEPVAQKVPTADLLDGIPGRTDEDELGLSYDDVDDYLEGRPVSDAAAEVIEARWLATRHKRTTPVTVADDWWRG